MITETPNEILGKVAELWRYPVSGLQGERLARAEVLARGLYGDHTHVIRTKGAGKVLDPKNFQFSWGESLAAPGMLELKSRLDELSGGAQSITITVPDGRVLSCSDPKIDSILSEILRQSVELVEYPRMVESRTRSGRTLHLLTSASLTAIRSFHPEGDFDVRRFRPNIVITAARGLSGFVEEAWVGREMTVGVNLRLRVEKPNKRCKVTGMKQGDLGEDLAIFQTIESRNSRNLGVMCTVVNEGPVSVGDSLALVR